MAKKKYMGLIQHLQRNFDVFFTVCDVNSKQLSNVIVGLLIFHIKELNNKVSFINS